MPREGGQTPRQLQLKAGTYAQIQYEGMYVPNQDDSSTVRRYAGPVICRLYLWAGQRSHVYAQVSKLS